MVSICSFWRILLVKVAIKLAVSTPFCMRFKLISFPLFFPTIEEVWLPPGPDATKHFKLNCLYLNYFLPICFYKAKMKAKFLPLNNANRISHMFVSYQVLVYHKYKKIYSIVRNWLM